MKKLNFNHWAFVLCFLFLIACLSGVKKPDIKPAQETIELRVSKVYTLANSVKCYELVPTGKYKDLNRVVITGDPGISELTLNKHVKMIIGN